MLVLGFTSAFYSIFYICSQHFFYKDINNSGELCRFWNFVNAYVFCLPWIIFVGWFSLVLLKSLILDISPEEEKNIF